MASLLQLVDYGTDSEAGSEDEDREPLARSDSQDSIPLPAVEPAPVIEAPEIVNEVATPPVSDDESEGDWPFKVNFKLAARLIPPPPGSNCSNSLQRKIENLIEKRRQQGINLNESVQRRKDFRNPSIYEKLVSFLGLDELGTCFPESMYNASSWSEDHNYETLAKIQREAHEKKKASRTQIEFVKGSKRPAPPSAPEGDAKKRKSRWDTGAPGQAPA